MNVPSPPQPLAGVFLGCVLVSVIAVAGLVVLVVVPALHAHRAIPPPPEEMPAPEPIDPTAPTMTPEPAPPSVRVSWSPHPGIPLLVDVNGDGIDDYVGRVVVESPPAPRLEVRITAYDGKTFAPLWTAGSFGDDAFGTRDVVLVAGHGYVAAMDGKARYGLIDARTGAEVLSGEGDEAGMQSCVSEKGAPALWLGPRRGLGVLFDVDAKRATPTPRPAWCTVRKTGPSLPSAEGGMLPWDAGGMIKTSSVREGPLRFAFGINNWTKKVITVAGFGKS